MQHIYNLLEDLNPKPRKEERANLKWMLQFWNQEESVDRNGQHKKERKTIWTPLDAKRISLYVLLLFPVSYWLDSLIGPSGLL